MSKIKVIHLISSFGRGGRERQLATITKYSDSRKVESKAVSFKQNNSSYIIEYGLQNCIIFLKEKSILYRYLKLRRLILKEKASLIWTWGGVEATFGILLAFSTNIKHINGSIRHGIVLFKIHQLWRMLILHLSKNIVANSYAGLRANLLKKGLVLYNGIDNMFFIEPEKGKSLIRHEFGIGEDNLILISVANLVPYKDYKTVLKALSIIKIKGIQFYYIAIGDGGTERKRVEDFAEDLNLSHNVSFIGSRSDIKEILYASDIFIHSSRGEGCSNAILEAMSAGLPIIASDKGGTREIIDDEVGRLFEYKNFVQLANKIEELIKEKSMRELLGFNAREKAKQEFSVERMMSKYYNIIEEVNG